MTRRYAFAACLALTAISLSACSRNNNPSPQTANQPAAAPQVQSDHGADDPRDADPAVSPRVSLQPPREADARPSRFAPLDEPQPELVDEPIEEEPATPSIFRSLGRALTRGVTDAVKGDQSGAASESPSPDASQPDDPNPEGPQPEARPEESPEQDRPQP